MALPAQAGIPNVPEAAPETINDETASWKKPGGGNK